MKRKIAVYTPMWPTPRSPGFGVFVADFYHQLKSDLRLETHITHSYTDLSSSKIERLKDLVSSSFRFIAIGIKYEIWYIHYLPLTAPLISITARILNKIIVFNLHGDELINGGIKRQFLRHSTRLLLSNYNNLYFIVPSSYFSEATVNWIGENKINSIFISASSGVPDTWFRCKQLQESNLGTKNRPLVLGYVGRLDPGKNWEITFSICKDLNKRKINSKVLICGWGSDSDKVAKKGVASDVSLEFIPSVERKDLPEVYAKIDLLVFCSTRPGESLGLVGLEALASGIPVIAHPSYGPATYISHKQNGYLIPSINHDTLSELADWIVEYINLYDIVSLDCMNSVRDFRASQVAKLLIEHLLSLTKNK